MEQEPIEQDREVLPDDPPAKNLRKRTASADTMAAMVGEKTGEQSNDTGRKPPRSRVRGTPSIKGFLNTYEESESDGASNKETSDNNSTEDKGEMRGFQPLKSPAKENWNESENSWNHGEFRRI